MFYRESCRRGEHIVHLVEVFCDTKHLKWFQFDTETRQSLLFKKDYWNASKS